MPVRTRLLRPDLFSDDVTGTLAPATLLAYLGLATRADDAAFRARAGPPGAVRANAFSSHSEMMC
jgi:hypothetical protein